MPLPSGFRLGPYEIVSALGAGGMGEVYRARDTKLKRDVALKVLPGDVAGDHERLARFQREAEVLASLNHPHIAHIYGVDESQGTSALVMELVEGDDLAQRIARGPIPLDEALPIARQIAEALEAAHDAGIIHRDLKPANIKVRPDGTVKVLDFGLAKALEPVGGTQVPRYDGAVRLDGGLVAPNFSSASAANSPTIASPAMTMRGVILGTAAYMAPEQAKGKAVDKRADVWAFGCVLYEMLTGRRLFAGEDMSEVMAAVLRQELNLDRLPAETPSSIRDLLVRCLERDPRRRLRDIGDAAWHLDVAARPPDRGGARSPRGRQLALVIAVSSAVGIVAAGVAWRMKPDALPVDAPVIATSYPLGATMRLTLQRQQIAISPDGRFIAAIADCCIALRRVDSLTSTVISGTDGVQGVFFSPDSRWLGFWTNTAFLKIPLAGGPVSAIAPHGSVVVGGPAGASWADNALIYYATLDAIAAVPAGGGQARVILRGANLGHPHVLPGSRMMLMTRGRTSVNSPDAAEIVLHTIETGESVVLTTGTSPSYAANGHVLFARGSDVLAAPLDLIARKLAAEPAIVAQQVAMIGSFSQYALSTTGTLASIPGAAASQPRGRLVRVSAAGAARGLGTPEREYSDPRVSPDGRQLAVHLSDQENDVWIAALDRRGLTRVTFDPLENETPAWSPDAAWLAYAGWSADAKQRIVERRPADGSGAPEVLWRGELHSHVTDWSPDGRWIVVEVQHADRGWDLQLIDLSAKNTVTPYLERPFGDASARVSPDSRLIAYRSNESGRNEVFVQSFPTPGRKVQVSTSGGTQPVWSRDGRTLYYRSSTHVMAVPITTAAAVQVGNAVELFKDVYGRPLGENHINYDVFADGSFVFIEPVATTDSTAANPTIVARFNWLRDATAKLAP